MEIGNLLKRTVLLFVIILGVSPALAQDAPSLDRLDWMIGTWRFEDRAMPAAGFDYAEAGERICTRVLDGRYIQCISTGHTEQSQRTYIHYWTWNDAQARFELISLFGNTPVRSLAYGTVSEDGRVIELSDDPYDEDGSLFQSHYRIEYDGLGSFVWESRRGPAGEAPLDAVRFREESTRLNEQ